MNLDSGCWTDVIWIAPCSVQVLINPSFIELGKNILQNKDHKTKT